MQPVDWCRSVFGFELRPLARRDRHAADADDIAEVAVIAGMAGTGVGAHTHNLSYMGGHLLTYAMGISWAYMAGTGRKQRATVADQSDDRLSEIANALKLVLRAGLPLRPDAAPTVLLDLASVVARSVRTDDRLARVDALERLLRATLKKPQPQDRRDATEGLFVVARGGRTLTQRRLYAADILGYEEHHFRKRIEPKLLEEIAWLLHQDSLQYIRRTRDGAPFEASGHTPLITKEQLEHPDTAEHEVLLSRIWSDVYGLRAELIAREASRNEPEGQAELQEAAVGALWYLARLLSKLSHYSERYGRSILHGTAEYNAEALIRLAGWSGELTSEQARDLRFTLAQVGEWDRAAFATAISNSESEPH